MQQPLPGTPGTCFIFRGLLIYYSKTLIMKMTNKPIHFMGAFVIRRQDHGILTSTYFNCNAPDPHPETMKWKSKLPNVKGDDKDKAADAGNDPFAGVYKTGWLEQGRHQVGELIIQPNGSMYELTWNDIKSPGSYGHATREGDILFGYYWGA